MDELTRGIQDELPWCMLFVDDIFLIDETRVGVNTKLERWRDLSFKRRKAHRGAEDPEARGTRRRRRLYRCEAHFSAKMLPDQY